MTAKEYALIREHGGLRPAKTRVYFAIMHLHANGIPVTIRRIANLVGYLSYCGRQIQDLLHQLAEDGLIDYEQCQNYPGRRVQKSAGTIRPRYQFTRA